MITYKDYLYYGCRSHQIIKQSIIDLQLEPEPFQAPHFDAVTSLALLEGVLVSGSRDKSLRTWDITSEQCQNVQMEVAHKDWINTLASKYD